MSDARIIRTVTELLVTPGEPPRVMSVSTVEVSTDGPIVYNRPEPVRGEDEYQYPLTGKERMWSIVSHVVDSHDYLSLDDEGDKQVLIEALMEALTP